MNFLNEFKVNIDAENGQLIMERKDLVRETESPAIREEKNHTISEVYNHIDQIEIAIRAKENIIKELESDIRLTEEKKEKVESILKETFDSTRFESSDISSNTSKKRRMEKYEEILVRLNRRIEIQRDGISIHQKQIDQLRDRIDYYNRLIEKMR
jgi:predicted  nucleic acid-binding Zn-ribbon protein